MNSRAFILLNCFLALLLSCGESEEYYVFKHISDGQWSKDSVVCLQFDSLRLNSSDIYHVDIEIVHNKSYPYQDLWLLIGENLQDSILQYDTLKCWVSDQFGRWLGSGGSGLHQLSVSYKKNINVQDTVRNYCFFIQQFMKDDPLLGVEKIGVKIYKAKNF
jgi:gliding motility-associated lipoprotein GldH